MKSSMARSMATAVLRGAFRAWPIMRGRGWLLRLSRMALGTRPVRFTIGRLVQIEGDLDDWMIVWAFMRGHERDRAFQRSIGLSNGAGIVLDIGAHAGIWSLLVAEQNQSADIRAFEPSPAAVEQLRRHLHMNGLDRIVVHPVGVGDRPGTRAFFQAPRSNSGASSFFNRQGSAEIAVPVVTVDAYLAREGLSHVDVIKVDVEGAEMLVFEGASRLLASDGAPMLFFELNDDLCASYGVTSQEVKRRLIAHGYRICRWERSRFSPVSVDEPHRGEDLFAFKAHHLHDAGRR